MEHVAFSCHAYGYDFGYDYKAENEWPHVWQEDGPSRWVEHFHNTFEIPSSKCVYEKLVYVTSLLLVAQEAPFVF